VQHPLQIAGQPIQLRPVRLPVDLHVDPGLDNGVVVVASRAAADLDELPGEAAADHHLRVNDEVDGAILARQLHRHGVDEEGHVVDDHLDDGVPGGPSVMVDRRSEDTHRRTARRAFLGKLTV
jgi:hypothetical protein